MRYVAMIQARCGSTRLPNKVLADLCGKPVLQRVIERVQKSKNIDEVMVVTSIERNNLPLIKLCTELDVRVFVGSETDVLDRYYQAARLISPDYIARITADCPLYDWNTLDDMIESINPKTDYYRISNEEFPDGLDTEIISFKALRKAWKDARLVSEREHVTLYIKNHPEEFSLQDYVFPIPNTGHYRWTLDEQSDYQMIDAVYKYFTYMGKEDFGVNDIIDYLNSHPEIEALNGGIVRNEGLLKSLREDHTVE